MKKLLFIFLITLIVAGVFFAPINAPFANAQTSPMPSASAAVRTSSDYPCAGLTPNVICDLAAKLIYVPLVFTSWILWLTGALLNVVVKFTVIDLALNIRDLTGIETAWRVIRDLANITFIFVLLYAAIRTILGVSDRKVKDVIVGVVIAATLINFSMFFTKIIVDASNLVAITFYNQIAPGAGSSSPTGPGLATSFMEPLKLQTLFSVADDPTAGSGAVQMLVDLKYNYGQLAIISVGGSIFLVTTSFVFLAVSIMFIIRFVNIIFLLILSPIGIAGSVMPGLKSSADKWWKSLTDQAVFAPVYMIMTWVVLTVFRSGNFLLTPGSSAGGGSTLAGAFQGIAGGIDPASGTGNGTFGLIMNFVIIIVFAIATLVISKQVSGQAGSIGQKVVGAALGAGAGIAGWGGRKFIGSAARGMADSEKLKEKASEKGLGGMGARLALRASQKTAGASFDARSSKALGAVGGAVGFDMAKEFGAGQAGGKGGYDDITKKKVEAEKKFADSFKPADYVVDEAVQELERVKKLDINSSEFKAEHKKDIEGAQRELQQAKDKKYRAVEKGTLTYEQMVAYDREIKELENKEANIRDAKGYLETKKDVAQKKVDRFKGVDDDEAKKRVRKQERERLIKEAREQGKNITEKGLQDELKTYMNSEVAQAKIETTKQKGLGAKRKESYAEAITTPNWVGTTTVPFSGISLPWKPPKKPKIKREYRQATAEIRRGEKPVKDQLEKILKDAGELKVEEGGSSETAPPSAPPASPSGGGATPSGSGTPTPK